MLLSWKWVPASTGLLMLWRGESSVNDKKFYYDFDLKE